MCTRACVGGGGGGDRLIPFLRPQVYVLGEQPLMDALTARGMIVVGGSEADDGLIKKVRGAAQNQHLNGTQTLALKGQARCQPKINIRVDTAWVVS